MTRVTSIVLATAAVFAPIKATLITVLVLTLVDLILGVWAARKRGEALTSAGLRRSAVKLFVYEAALLLGFLAETYLLDGALPTTKLIGSIIGLTELKSIFENLNTISGFSLLKGLVDWLHGPTER